MIENFRTLPLAAVSDALDVLGIPGQCVGIRPVFPGARMAGRAFAVCYAPASGIPGGTVGDYVEDVRPGEVVVIANGGREDCTVWGDLLTLAAIKRGIAGTVIDGVCRDSEGAAAQGFPLFARGVYMRTGKGRVALKATQQPIPFAGIVVSPGDIVVGGADGLLAVPTAHAKEVAALAREIAKKEDKIRKIVAVGGSLKEAREKAGYHGIGRKQ